MVGVFSATWIGASMWVPRCMMPSNCCTSSPSLAWNSTTRTLRLAREGHCGMPWPQRWLRSKNCRSSVVLGMSVFARLQPIMPRRIQDRHQADHAGVALEPFPREALEGAALAGDGVEVAADVLHRRDPGGEQGAVRRVPLGEVGDRLAA